MAQDGFIRVRIDESTKQAADSLFQDLGMDTSTAIRIFLRQSVKRGGLPLRLPILFTARRIWHSCARPLPKWMRAREGS